MMSRWLSILGVGLAVASCVSAPPIGSAPGGDDSDGDLRELAAPGEGTTCEGGQGTVIGRINDKYLTLGGCESFLGVPLTDERRAPDGVGRYSVFENGSIYWTPSLGAHEVHGAIRGAWAKAGWEAGALGYPISDEYVVPEGRRNDFAGGNIVWNASSNTTAVQVTDTRGEATYYYYESGGACGIKPPPDKLIAAINDEQYSKANCGRCAKVTGPKGSVVVKILDKCPGCDRGDLDLSAQAFDRIASRSAGRIKIGWHFVDCP